MNPQINEDSRLNFTDSVEYLKDLKIVKNEENILHAAGRINKNLRLFEGHFPDMPVMPGAFHILMAVKIIEKSEGKAFFMSKVKGAKFRIPLYPGDLIEIYCNLKSKESKSIEAQCIIRKGGREASKFNLLLIEKSQG